MADRVRDQQQDPAEALAPLTALARQKLPATGTSGAAAERLQREGYERLDAALHSARRRAPLRRPALALALAGAAAAAVFATTHLRTPRATQPLTFTVEGAGASEGGYVRAETAPASIHFSDGTAVKLEAATHGRVAWTSPRGARVMLDNGRARVDVVHRERAEWLFDAGPFVIQVTGTSFDVHWSAGEQVLEVTMHTGAVTVRGPLAPDGVRVRQGQKLVMGVRDGVMRVERTDAPARPVAAAAVAAPPAEAPTVEPESAAPAVAHRPPPETTRANGWAARVASGDFAGVLTEARRRGVDTSLRALPAADVMALADAARYANQPALARRALLAERQRFAGSELAQRAGFLLGRLAEDRDADLARAIEWYDLYLREAPTGAFRSEALGRKMTATLHLHGRDRARPLAEEVLRRAPTGPYAEAARKILAQ